MQTVPLCTRTPISIAELNRAAADVITHKPPPPAGRHPQPTRHARHQQKKNHHHHHSSNDLFCSSISRNSSRLHMARTHTQISRRSFVTACVYLRVAFGGGQWAQQHGDTTPPERIAAMVCHNNAALGRRLCGQSNAALHG